MAPIFRAIPDFDLINSTTEVHIPCTENSVSLGASATTKAVSLELLNLQAYMATPVATATALRNVAEAWTRDGQQILVQDTGLVFRYDASSSAVDDGTTVLAPTWAGATGRFVLSSYGHTIQDEGTPLTARANLNFVGAGVVATDDAGNDATVITISSTAPALALQEQTSAPPTAANEIKLFNEANSLQWRLESDGFTYTVAGLEKANTWTGAQGTAEVTLSDGANISVDASLSNAFTVTLAGNRTLDNPAYLVAGFTYTFRIKQDATGSRTLAYGTAYKFPGGSAPVLTTTPNAIDMLTCTTDGTSLFCTFAAAFS